MRPLSLWSMVIACFLGCKGQNDYQGGLGVLGTKKCSFECGWKSKASERSRKCDFYGVASSRYVYNHVTVRDVPLLPFEHLVDFFTDWEALCAALILDNISRHRSEESMSNIP